MFNSPIIMAFVEGLNAKPNQIILVVARPLGRVFKIEKYLKLWYHDFSALAD